MEFETGGRVAAADFDPAWDDPRDVRTVLDDAIENLVKSADAPVLSFDSADFHNRLYTDFALHSAQERAAKGEFR